VAALGLAVLFAFGLSRILLVRPGRRRPIVLVAGALILFELWPAPRVLHSARIPAIYSTVAADPRDVAVLCLPLGIRDGVRAHGAFNTATQYYQTFHRKRIVGGYISRLPEGQIRRHRSHSFVNALLRLSERRAVDPGPPDVLRERARRFVERVNLGYVVVDTARTPATLFGYAREALDLEFIVESDGLALYRPGPAATGHSVGKR
jgi:hypothetical protein